MTKGELKILKGCPLFKDSEYDVDADVKLFASGETICSPGEEKNLGILLSGRAKAVADDGQTLLNIFDKGDVFKAAGLFGENETCTCVVAETAVKAVFFDKQQMESIFQNDNVVLKNYLKFLSDRIAFLNQKISFFSLPSTETRLARFLYCANSDVVNVSGAKLCLILSVSRASLYRAFHQLESVGSITQGKGRITIKDREKLLKITKEKSL